MKNLRKIYTLIALMLIAIISVSTLSYALFIYTDNTNAKLDDMHATTNNVSLGTADTENYRIYFFASPYYATGANLDGTSDETYSTIADTDEQDPLKIANAKNNPYNSDDDYFIAHSTHSNEYEKNFYTSATSKQYTYISASSITQTGANSASITPYKKSKFSGYIRENTTFGINTTSTYYSTVVNGHLTSELLANVIAQSVYKDEYGFGPEFMGWTYQKEKVKERTIYSSAERYGTTTSNISYSDGTATYNSSTTNSYYTIGNYGKYPDEIEIVSDRTSLKYIDTGDVKDGSSANDKIIYLYPVFGAKQLSSRSTYPNLVKLRKNAGDNPGLYQSDEIDYDQNRYTAYAYYSSNNTHSTPNYYVKNYYISDSTDTTDTNRVDVAFFYNGISSSSYESSETDNTDWTTLFSDTTIKGLGLEEGYYNIDISLWWTTSSVSEVDSTTVSSFISTNIYDNYSTIHSSFTLYNSTYYYSCIIGFHKVNNFHITGSSINGDISSYDGDGYKVASLASQNTGTSNRYYYVAQNVELQKGDTFTVLNKDYASSTNGYKDITYSLSAMDDTYLKEFNDTLSSATDEDSKKEYSNISIDNSDISLNSEDNSKSLVANSSNVYSFLFVIEYTSDTTTSKGNIISSISIAYKTVTTYFKFAVLSDPILRAHNTTNHSKHSNIYYYDDKYHYQACNLCGKLDGDSVEHSYTNDVCTVCGYIKGSNLKHSDNFDSKAITDQYFTDFNHISSYDSYLCSGTYKKGTVINWDTKLITPSSGSSNLGDLFLNYWKYELVDLSTGLVFDYRIFLTDNFKLDRNYICYIRLRTDTSQS